MQPETVHRLNGPWPGTAGFVRLIGSGAIEIELYDYSKNAQAAFGGDIATIYTVQKEQFVALAASLRVRLGSDVADAPQFVQRLSSFDDVSSLIDWLRHEARIPVEKRVEVNV